MHVVHGRVRGEQDKEDEYSSSRSYQSNNILTHRYLDISLSI